VLPILSISKSPTDKSGIAERTEEIWGDTVPNADVDQDLD